MTISKHPHSYDLVKWKYEPYTIQSNDEKHELFSGDIVVDVTHLNKRKVSKKLLYHVTENEAKIRLQHVVMEKITLDPVRRNYSTKSKKNNDIECGYVNNETNDSIIDEINRRESIEYDEEIYNEDNNVVYDDDFEIS